MRRAVLAHLGALSRQGAGYFGGALAQRDRLRQKLGALLGADASEVALVSNTSLGVTMVALSLPWRPRDRVLCFEGEFPANVTPWQRAAALFDLEFELASADAFRTRPDEAMADLEARLSRGLRVVALSAVQFQTGFKMPWAEIARRCHAHGAELFVDAIQACGAVPLDVTRDGIDYLVSGGHKWLMGLEGAGVLVARQAAAARFHPHLAGWLSHQEPFRFLTEGPGHLRYDRPFVESARRFEVGTLSAEGYAALEASVDLLTALGVEAIAAHVDSYLVALEAGLVARGFESLRSPTAAGRSSILGVIAPEGREGAAAWQRGLAAHGVVTSCPDGVLRFAPHWPNNFAREGAYVLGAVDALLQAQR